jgi:hypothetical protein
MRQLTLFLYFSLLANAAFAEGIVEVPLPPAGGDKVLQSGNSAPKAETLPTIVIPDNPVPATADCPPPQAVPESDADKLRKQRAQLATKWIESLRGTIKDTARSGSFFSTLFTSSKQPVDTELLGEMDRFIVLHPDMPEAADVYLLKSQVHMRMESYGAAALDLLMLMTAYPDSPLAGEASRRLNELSGDQLKKQASVVGLLAQKAKALSGDRDQRVAAYLADIGTTLNDADFAQPIASECASFLQSNRSFLNEDIVEHALARQSMLIDDRIALYHFNKLLALYPSSPTLPDSLLSMGNVQRKGLKLYTPRRFRVIPG